MLRVKVVRTKESIQEYAQAWKRIEDTVRILPDQVTKPIMALMQEAVKDIFAQEGIPGVHKWRGLHITTVRRRKQQGFGGWHPILVRTGALFESLYEGITTVGRGANRSIILTSKDWRFPILHAGMASVNIPSRPMLPVGSYLRKLILVTEREILLPAIDELMGVTRYVRR